MFYWEFTIPLAIILRIFKTKLSLSRAGKAIDDTNLWLFFVTRVKSRLQKVCLVLSANEILRPTGNKVIIIGVTGYMVIRRVI